LNEFINYYFENNRCRKSEFITSVSSNVRCTICFFYVSRVSLVAMVTAMDEAVGDVIIALRRRNIINDTLIVFVSDVSSNFLLYYLTFRSNYTIIIRLYSGRTVENISKQ